jgi:hypothetical protein
LAFLPEHLALFENNLTAQNGVARPILDLKALVRGIIDIVVQVFVCNGFGTLVTGVPDDKIRVAETRKQSSLRGITPVEFGGVGRCEFDELLRRYTALDNTVEEEG